ncbi:MAG: class I SAM-dependent methyltransferase [candidate division Zixibacteria bacterium]|nr:class I SAM-dependent methyltransferase [candidate division Zixibacteria bacterium]
MRWWENFFDEYYPEVYANLETLTSKEIDGVVKILGVKPRNRILDLCCGYGRHSHELARRGYKVTGYDLSSFFIQRAKREAESLKIKVKFVQGDMRELPFKSEFNSVINMFTSFGYFQSERDNLKVLKGINAALRPKGLFLLDTINRELILKDFQMRRWVQRKNFWMLEDSLFDPFTSRQETTRTLLFENQPRREYFFSLRLYTLTEMLSNLKNTGFIIEQVLGDFDLNEYSTNSPRMIILARKKR